MVIVKVNEGLLEGEQRELITGDGVYYSFKGVPYAAPPIGKLRFKPPERPQSWSGIRKSLQHSPVCTQYDDLIGAIRPGSEDCLYLNVYSPELKPSGPGAPVMMWFHGGAYKFGSGNSDHYGPDFLLQRGVLLVTINYRLEVLGFLCLDTADVPGNAGLKDQVAALRWIRDNIASFGGDPANVTIFGESAGGASVGYHLLSPLSVGLFHRAILMSGVPLNDWASTFQPRRRAQQLARQLGASDETVEDSDLLLEFLQSIPVEKLVNCKPDILLIESQPHTMKFYFNVVVEKDFGSNQQFITKAPLEYLRHGNIQNVEILIGYTSEECIMMAGAVKGYVALFDQYIENLLPKELALKLSVDEGFNVAKRIRERYFGKKTITCDSIEEIVRYYSWAMFKYGVLRFLRLIAKHSTSNKYLYQFSCKSELNIFSNAATATVGRELEGVSHLEDIPYLFSQAATSLPLDKSSKSYKMIQQTTALFTNFAKYGNPTPDSSLEVKWQPYTNENEEFLSIGELLMPGTKLEHEEFEFWDALYSLIQPINT